VKRAHQLIAVIRREDEGHVARCPKLGIASEGETVVEARANLVEALELFFEAADPSEVEARLHSEVFITPSSVYRRRKHEPAIKWCQRRGSDPHGHTTRGS
jgi:predicted RNase H-like HicB family nuclease